MCDGASAGETARWVRWCARGRAVLWAGRRRKDGERLGQRRAETLARAGMKPCYFPIQPSPPAPASLHTCRFSHGSRAPHATSRLRTREHVFVHHVCEDDTAYAMHDGRPQDSVWPAHVMDIRITRHMTRQPPQRPQTTQWPTIRFGGEATALRWFGSGLNVTQKVCRQTFCAKLHLCVISQNILYISEGFNCPA